jgi:hypothetical protein
MSFTFDDTGTGGTFESGGYKYDYPSSEAESTGTYNDKKYYMYSGERGSFTWDPETKVLSKTFAEIYTQKNGVETEYENDYMWRDIKFSSRYGIGTEAGADDSASFVSKSYWIINEDTLPWWDEYPYFREAEGSGTWSAIADHARDFSTYVKVVTEGGSTTKTVAEMHETISITSGSLVVSGETVTTVTIDGGEPTKTTYRSVGEYEVLQYFLKSVETGDRSFGEVWTEGNTVRFNCERKRYVKIWYEGDAVPPEPAVDPVTGEGGEWDGNLPDYYINENDGYTRNFIFTHFGDHIWPAYELNAIFRGIDG